MSRFALFHPSYRKLGLTILVLWLLAFDLGSTSFSTNTSPSRILTPHISDSCTIFTVTHGNKVFFGNNEDYHLWGIYLWFVPAQTIWTPSSSNSTYGAVFFGFDNNDDALVDGAPQGGMNDQGLCMDGNGLSMYSLNPHPERDPIHCSLMAQVLWECATVEDVVTWFQTHQLRTQMNYQLHYADATGDAVVVSAGPNQELAFTHIGPNPCLVSANINVADPARDVYDCWRYSTAMSALMCISTESALTVDACRDVLDAVHQSITKYSNVYDCVTRDIYLWYDRDYTNCVTMNLDTELTAVQPGSTGYTEALSLFYAFSGNGNLCYRKVPITNFISSQPPPLTIYLVVAVGGIIVTSIIITSIVLLYRRRKSQTRLTLN